MVQESDFIRAIGKHERSIRGFIRGCGVYRADDIDEIMQEVLVKAWAKKDQLQKAEEFPKWAMVIARYEVLNFRKKKARDRLILNEKVTELLIEEGLKDDQREDLLKQLEGCVNQLNPHQRELIQTAYTPNNPMDALTQTFGLKANAIYQKLWRIRQKLAQCMKEGQDLKTGGAT